MLPSGASQVRPTFAVALAGAAVLLAPTEARAIEPDITADTAAQFYDVRSPTGETIITRRRLTTTLGVSVYDLYDTPNNPLGPSITFRARLRYDADYGGSDTETSPTSAGLVPGFERGPVDLMYGYVEGRRFLHGWLGFKVGRQYVTDSLGWWSFDGGEVKITTPYYVAAELYGGLEQRGGLPLSTSRFERDGVWRGDRTGYDPSFYPSFQPNDVAPAYGVALESAGFTWLHSRLTYRRVYNTGGTNVSQFANGTATPVSYDGSRLSSERFGWGFDGTLPKLGGIKGGLQYDFYNAKMANIFASVDAYASKKLTLSVDYDYVVPTFDADSIWNFFMAMPMNDVSLRGSYDATDHLAFSAGGHVRLFSVQNAAESGLTEPTSPNNLAIQNYYPAGSLNVAGGGNVSARWHFGEGAIGAHGAADFADNGERLGMDVYGERTLETRFVLSARTGVWQWKDDLRPDRDAGSFQYVLGIGYKLLPRSLAFWDFEHDINRLAGQRFRTMFWLNLAFDSALVKR